VLKSNSLYNFYVYDWLIGMLALGGRNMRARIHPIRLPLPFHLGSVNSYLISTNAGYVLVDTGGSNGRKELLRTLENAGCKPGLLKLMVITHGDFDHTGNAAYLRRLYNCQIAMHSDDAGMAERGDMFVNRKKPNPVIRALLPVLTGFGRSERFKPDLLLEDGDDLSAYGFEARVLSIPGHSKGSIGILTATGELFCGDLLENRRRPTLHSLMDDPTAAKASLQKLRNLRIGMVYPGHGEPFPMDVLEGSAS
jgi:hydroxyacylglutathione hydrolase